MYDFFTSFCGRTLDPSSADYFYLPVIRDIEYRMQLNVGNRKSTLIEQVLIDLIEKNSSMLWKSYLNITDEFWFRNGGADHIIVMPAPVTNLRHQANARGFFHYMIQLSSPIFFNVEYSRSFTEEYPICSRRKNIVLPYPSTDPDLYSGRLIRAAQRARRTKLLFYQGGAHGSCMAVRNALGKLARNSELAPATKKREIAFGQAVFCPIPIGDSPSSKRMYDVMHFGCVPVVLSDELVWSFTEETGGPLRASDFSIQLPQAVGGLLNWMPVTSAFFYVVLCCTSRLYS